MSRGCRIWRPYVRRVVTGLCAGLATVTAGAAGLGERPHVLQVVPLSIAGLRSGGLAAQTCQTKKIWLVCQFLTEDGSGRSTFWHLQDEFHTHRITCAEPKTVTVTVRHLSRGRYTDPCLPGAAVAAVLSSPRPTGMAPLPGRMG